MVESSVEIRCRGATRRPSTRVVVALSGLIGLAVLSGCAHYTAGVASNERASTSSAYLYGHFFVRTTKKGFGVDGYQTMGLVISCDNGEAYTIRFSNQRQVQVIKIAPSRCALTEIVYTDPDGAIKRRAPPPPPWRRAHDFQPGRAYYLGDYAGTASFESEWKVVYGTINWSWTMDPIDNPFQNYDATTIDMQVAFKGLAALPTDDARLVPRPRRPLIEGAPISPEQAARIVRFTKRSYPGVNECRAACPTGQCIPFRGASGPEIACINRCTGDKDCPDGLACNCAGDERPGCHAIAQAPGDHLDGLCLAPAGP
jgi:hypothetical protein